MGKFRKMLAGVLSAAMVLSTMTVTAFAAETKMPTIDTDTTKKGSITINKYEGSGTSKPLAGVEFTIYKVADLEQSSSNNVELKYKSLIEDVEITSDTKYVENNEFAKAVNKAIAENKLSEAGKNTTNTSGQVKFENLSLGIYLVVETDAPSQVVNKTANFLVSVPMTNEAGDDWVYDITANPKNETVYGEITLRKKGKTIEVNGSATEETLKNVSFELQKKETTGWTNVDEYKTNESGEINVTRLAPATYRFIETSRGTNDGYIMDGATEYKFTVNSDGTITYNSQKKKNITITVKNEKPDMTKQVQKRNDTNPWGQDADYSVGDMVPYKITIGVPSNITKLKEFTLTDTPTNLEDDLNSVVVKCGETTLTTDGDYTIGKDTTDGKGFKITFTTANMESYAGKQIVVTYNAKLLDSADTTTVKNPNTAKLEYSNEILPGQNDTDNPNKHESPDTTPGKDSIEDNAVVYTFKLQILKKAEKADGAPLQDVEFDLYKEVSAGTKNAITGDDAKNVGLSRDKHWLKINTDSLKTNGNGEVSQSGLANGTYYLVETKTNKDYNLLKAPVEVKLDIVYTTTTKTEWGTDENGVKTLVKNKITKTEFKEGENTSTGTHTETIINKKGFELPITGGMGTVLFSIAGFALMAGAAFVLLKGRRKDA